MQNNWLAGAALATLAVCTCMHPARAGGPDSVKQVISAADLDLCSSAGQAALRRRVAMAALQVCEVAMDDDVLHDCAWRARHRAAAQVRALIASAQGGSEQANILAATGPSR